MIDDKPSDVHNYIESYVKQMALFKLPRNEAILHVLRKMERLFVDATIGMRDFQDMLRYLLYWIFTFSDAEGGRPVRTTRGHLQTMNEVLQCAKPYSKIYDFLSAVQRGKMAMTGDDTLKIISFKYLDENIGKQFGIKWLNKEQKLHDSLNNVFTQDIAENMQVAVSELNGSVRSADQGGFTYSRPLSVLKGFQRTAEKLIAGQFVLPSDWDLGDYSLGDLRLVWSHVLKIALIYNFALRHHMSRNRVVSYDCAIYQENKDNFLKHIAMHSGLRKDIIEKIVSELSYDVKIKHTDIMFQPFFKIADKIVFSPSIIMSSNAERNLIALLNRRQSKIYDDLKNKKEDLMIADLTAPLHDNGYFFKERVNLKENRRPVTDIDLLLWDSGNRHLLILQLKWLNGADSTIEVLNNDEEFGDGIEQIKEAYRFLEQNPSFLKSTFGMVPLNVYGVVVSKIGLPSPFLARAGIVFVESKTLIEGIQSVQGDIKGLYDFLKETSELDNDLSDYEMTFNEVNISEYTFRLPRIKRCETR